MGKALHLQFNPRFAEDAFTITTKNGVVVTWDDHEGVRAVPDVTFRLSTGEELVVTADKDGGFSVNYKGESEDREQYFNAGYTYFRNGFPSEPEHEEKKD